MKPPKNGCIVLEALRAFGYRVLGKLDPEKRRDATIVFDDAHERMMPGNVMAFYSPECPVKDGDDMTYLSIRPPYDDLWAETILPDGSPIGYAVNSGTYRMNTKWTYVRILAFWMPDKRRPAAVACVMYVLDERGRRVADSGYAPLYGASADAENQHKQDTHVFPCVRMLQRMNVTNIGFYCERDPDENNPAMTRAHRRKLIGRRYHVLVIREQRDMRAGRKVVDYKGVMPLHWSRGHYQHNGPASVHGHPDGQDRGLAFGWLAGVFFIPAAAKGRVENGEVDKGYRLAAPNAPKRLRRRHRHRHHNTAERETPTVRPVSVMFARSPSEARDAAVVFNPANVDQPARQEARQ